MPITGDNRSMRAIEFASLIAQASGGKVAAIAVAQEGAEEHSAAQLEAMFAHVREIGRHYEVEVRTIAGTGGRRELAILTHARRGRYNLIVLGVGRRAGDRLSLGSLADTLLETSDRSLALVITN